MSDDQKEAIERLERRLAELEGIVRQLVVRSIAAPAARDPRGPPARITSPAPVPAPAPLSPRVVVPRKIEILPSESQPGIDWEQWVGQRGLLIVGVLALLATGGFFLNYAIQHGWIAPLVRASGAVVAGAALVVWGDRLVRRGGGEGDGGGLLRYGAAIIGGGGGLVYLGVWAAAGLYGLVNRQVGVVLLAATSGVVVALAIRHNVEALAIWALAGAYLAPIFLAGPVPEPEKFLAYMAVGGTIFMILAQRVNWRATFNCALFGVFLIPAALIPHDLNSTAGLNYAALGAVVALLATNPKRAAATEWPEARVGALVMMWTVLFALSGDDTLRWSALGAGALITAIVWWQQRQTTPLAGMRDNSVGAEFIVYLTPLALVTLAVVATPSALVGWGGAIPVALAVLYLGSGWLPRTLHLVVMGFVLLALAVSGQWDGAAVAAGWALLAVAASASGRWAGRPGASEVSAVLAPVAFLQLFTVALYLRPATDPAFTGSWALAWYVSLIAFAVTARWWDTRKTIGAEDSVGVALWSLTAATLLIGVSFELQRTLHATPLAAAIALVWYWILFAVALVRGAPSWRPPLRGLALATGLLLLAGGYLTLFSGAWDNRNVADPAFTGLWSLGWYACCAAGVIAARWWPADTLVQANLRFGRAALWWMAGGCLLLGGSLELHRAFTSGLAGDLAISTFWLLYAGALVNVGFRLDRKAVRSAGLGVAALAALKIVLYDLSALQALYRVGSFFVLALITLAVAYAYNQKARVGQHPVR